MAKNSNMPYNDWESVMDKPTTGRVAISFKALSDGTASEEQQKLVIDFLIKIGCRTYDTDWFPEERTSCFAAGRRYVGQQIVRFINLKVGNLTPNK